MTEDRDFRTWYAYFLRGGNTTYVALKSGKEEYVIPYPNMSFDEAKRRVKKKHLYSNLDKNVNMFAKAMIEDCRKLAEARWRKDTGQLKSQVKTGGRE